MEKLRRDYIKERKMMAEAMKDVVTERRPPPHMRNPLPATAPTKLTIDPHKLEETIKKACIPVVKKSIQVLDKVPPKPEENVKPKPVAIAVCKAMNLNGTPCKCRAKVGKFCAKHAPRSEVTRVAVVPCA